MFEMDTVTSNENNAISIMFIGEVFCLNIQWNPDITMYQRTGEITSLYRGIVKPGFRSIHFTVLNIGRAEKC